MTTAPTTTVSTTTTSDSKDGVVEKAKTGTKPIKRIKTKGKPAMTKEERREKYTTIARQRQNHKKLKTVICYQCRQRGHSIQNCPNNKNNENSNEQISAVVGRENDDNDDEPNVDKEQQKPSKKLQKKIKRQQQQRDKNFTSSSSPICYKCGSTEHTLAKCPKRNVTNKRQYDNIMDANGECIIITNELLPFAKCFICQQNGHLASNCPQNKHGVYVTGNGCCRICQSKQHRVSDCPEKNKSKTVNVNDDDNPNMYYNNSDVMNDDENTILNHKNDDKSKSNDNSSKNNTTGTSATPKKRKVVKF